MAGSSRIEGPEGAGKTTQATALAEHLARRGLDVHVTREPGGTWLGERLRDVLLARTDSVGPTDPLDRRAAVQRRPPPARDRGDPAGARRRSDGRLRALRRFDPGLPGLRRRACRSRRSAPSRRPRPTASSPDLTILLDVPVEIGLARKAPGDLTRFEAEFDLAFHRRVRDGFLALAAAEPGRFAVVDAGPPRAGGRASPWPSRPTAWSSPVNRNTPRCAHPDDTGGPAAPAPRRHRRRTRPIGPCSCVWPTDSSMLSRTCTTATRRWPTRSPTASRPTRRWPRTSSRTPSWAPGAMPPATSRGGAA